MGAKVLAYIYNWISSSNKQTIRRTLICVYIKQIFYYKRLKDLCLCIYLNLNQIVYLN